MSAVILSDLHMKKGSTAYIDAMHAILYRKGWISCTKSMLAGMTVSGFRFTVDRTLSADSVHAYNWIAENFLAADFIGIISSQQAGFSFQPTFPLYQKEAIVDLKRAIDSGTGAVIWKDGFAIAVGYDDAEQRLYYSDGSEAGLCSMSYNSFGRNVSPYWYYQVFDDRIEMDEIEIYRESLIQAIYKWETHDLMLPAAEYACGRAAYDAILQALETEEYDRTGIVEVIHYYAEAKRDIRLYMSALQRIWPQMSAVIPHYADAARCVDSIAALLEQLPAGHRIDSALRVELIALLVEAREAEELAVQWLKSWMREKVNNRYQDIGLR
ncbi:hypothetical protein [Paenibacillus marinisediminis]